MAYYYFLFPLVSVFVTCLIGAIQCWARLGAFRATGAISFFNADTNAYNNTLRNAFLGLVEPNSASFGWGCDCGDGTGCVSVAAEHGIVTEPSKSDYSLLTYGGHSRLGLDCDRASRVDKPCAMFA